MYFDRVARLIEEGTPFVTATVTWRRGPSSGKAGAKAIVLADGSVEGWLGGACARPTVVSAALDSLVDGQPRLLVLGEHDHRPEVVIVAMACSSEGAMEVFVEPHLPAPDLRIVGSSPMVTNLADLATALDWRVTVTDEPSLDGAGADSWIVVATQGHYDEPAVEAALATPARYIGLVASSKRAGSVMTWLRDKGVSDEDLSRVRSPAGLDLGSTQHEEMAVAILAEIVSLKAIGHTTVEVRHMEQAIDPVCQMTVDIATARFSTEHNGTTYYFCAPGCQRAFEKDPKSFLQPK
ncbi:MAG: XdhC family protein, partial [Acidimicrobiia bacterium]